MMIYDNMIKITHKVFQLCSACHGAGIVSGHGYDTTNTVSWVTCVWCGGSGCDPKSTAYEPIIYQRWVVGG